MNFSNCLTTLLAFIWHSFFCDASLDCTFKDDFCDWKQTVKQCSWILSSLCPDMDHGCIYVTDNSGTNCSRVGLTAGIGSPGIRGISFEYFMIGYGGGTLLVKDNSGKTLWSYSGPLEHHWRPVQVLLSHKENTKAIILEAHFDSGSNKFIAVKNVLEVDEFNVDTPCSADAADTTMAEIATSSLSTMQDLSDSSPTTSIKTTAWSETTVRITSETSKTSLADVYKPTHAQTEVNQMTETHPTIQTSRETGSYPPSPDQFVSVLPSPTPKMSDHMSTSSLAAIITGVICFIILVVIVSIVTVKRLKGKTLFPHVSTSLHINPLFTDE